MYECGMHFKKDNKNKITNMEFHILMYQEVNEFKAIGKPWKI